ncbi:hypothetical protein CFP56_043139 [Quercus suber]|uniref:Uncharacterized protein n=1 Tax=Quercus suber TaxID=58331 RepID=A0AAW0LJJ0_QUESU
MKAYNKKYLRYWTLNLKPLKTQFLNQVLHHQCHRILEVMRKMEGCHNPKWLMIRRGLSFRLEILRAEVSKVACRVWNCAACARGFWSIASVTGVAAAVLLSFLYVRVQRWRQVLYKESKDRLIREKDEKISQLLLHIAQMNEAFSERRRVPVFQIG